MAKRIVWDNSNAVSVLKVAEGGPNVPGILADLKRAGIPAKRDRSCLVGHVDIVTAEGTLTKRRRIFRNHGVTWS